MQAMAVLVRLKHPSEDERVAQTLLTYPGQTTRSLEGLMGGYHFDKRIHKWPPKLMAKHGIKMYSVKESDGLNHHYVDPVVHLKPVQSRRVSIDAIPGLIRKALGN